MKPRTTRALLVLAVFALLAVLSTAGGYVHAAGKPVHRSTPVDLWMVFEHEFWYYLVWALVAPGIIWLGRKVPFRRRHLLQPLVFHFAVAVGGSLPFWAVLTLVGALFGEPLPSPATIHWGLVWARMILMVLPVYGLVLAVGAAVQVARDHTSNQMREVTLRRSLAAAQLDALRMKAQPQFLVSTLDAMAALARTGETDLVVRVVERLGTLLRLFMETSGRQVVRLEEELALLDEYLAIAEIRFSERLHVVRGVAPEVRNALVPNLILQLLVEHALIHGRPGQRSSCLLEIAAHRDRDRLLIAMRAHRTGSSRDPGSAWHGSADLRNVTERLDRLYAGRSRFDLTNDAAGRTRILLSLPFSETEAPAA